jgi:OPA family glycerol-3-phosphate transporter-like MFS transporter
VSQAVPTPPSVSETLGSHVPPLQERLTPAFRRRRAQNWVFLGLMYGFFYMGRYNFSAVSAYLAQTFGWSNSQLGTVISAGTIVYAFSVFLNGPLADKIGGKRAILIGCLGSAAFNLLFGLGYLMLGEHAVWSADSKTVLTPATLEHGLSMAAALNVFAIIWGLNHYFQSFGALSIVKINAQWFHVTERGSFAGIFGIMIQGGRTLAFSVGPLLLAWLPWQYVFWVPAIALGILFVLNKLLVENTPADAGLGEFDTGDMTKEEAAAPATLGFVLRKVFASRAAWIIALASMMIGFVRNSVDHWWAKYFSNVYHIDPKALGHFLPYQIASVGMPIAAICGGLLAGNISDKVFGARRAPVIAFAFIGQAVCLSLLGVADNFAPSPWMSMAMLIGVSMCIQGAHSMVGGAASMDFGGRKAVATAAGLFDGAQYLAGSIVGVGMGTLLDGYGWKVWAFAPVVFALIGCAIISQLWNVRPGRGGH